MFVELASLPATGGTLGIAEGTAGGGMPGTKGWLKGFRADEGAGKFGNGAGAGKEAGNGAGVGREVGKDAGWGREAGSAGVGTADGIWGKPFREK